MKAKTLKKNLIDQEILENIRSLLASYQFDLIDFEITIHLGSVYISGEVSDEKKKKFILSSIEKMLNVREVISNIVVNMNHTDKVAPVRVKRKDLGIH